MSYQTITSRSKVNKGSDSMNYICNSHLYADRIILNTTLSELNYSNTAAELHLQFAWVGKCVDCGNGIPKVFSYKSAEINCLSE